MHSRLQPHGLFALAKHLSHLERDATQPSPCRQPMSISEASMAHDVTWSLSVLCSSSFCSNCCALSWAVSFSTRIACIFFLMASIVLVAISNVLRRLDDLLRSSTKPAQWPLIRTTDRRQSRVTESLEFPSRDWSHAMNEWMKLHILLCAE